MTPRTKTLNKILYKPSVCILIVDLLILIAGVFIVLEWFPLKTHTPYAKYYKAAIVYVFFWYVISYLLGRYKPFKNQKYLKSFFKLLYLSLIIFVSMWLASSFVFNGYYSVYVIFTYTTILFLLTFAFYALYFAILYAVDYQEEQLPFQKRENATLIPAKPKDEESLAELYASITAHSGKILLDKLLKTIDLSSGNTYVNFSTNYLDLKSKPNYRYSCIVNMERLNDVRGINKLFATINYKLPDDGIMVCCYESKSTRKRRLLKKLIFPFNYVLYIIDYIIKRFIPKIFITRRLYYDLTGGKHRILSKAEVLGRLYCLGFEVFREMKVEQINYVYARRVKSPEPYSKKVYGPLIRLHRKGLNGKMFDVYKFRTMHPFSEYLQTYIYEKNSLEVGGKFKRDIRITTIGGIMRKYWIDEFPMIFNVIKGDMKLVGVRPLSNQYFSLYDKDLQDLRIQFKPGLLPPFYADMPKTLDEIQASERKYLLACKNNGTFITDFKYILLILKNILFRKARSA
ncbi:MAG: sugar transferase [Paludibacter sp.]|nr:sugar transferase [Paludibacter sp.]